MEELVVGNGTLPFESMKKELLGYKEAKADEFGGNIGKVLKAFDHSHLDTSVYLVAYRFQYVATNMARHLPHTEELFDSLIALLESRNIAVKLALMNEKCEV